MVQDIFLTETAQLADVVLPAASFAEKDGTFTNTERRCSGCASAVPAPGEARADWEIIADAGRRHGRGDWALRAAPRDILAEIAALTPSYGGISLRAPRREGGLAGRAPTPTTPARPSCTSAQFTRGKGSSSRSPISRRPKRPTTSTR